MALYKIYDNKAKVFDEDIIIQGDNSRDALQRHLDNLDLKFKRSGDTSCRFRVFRIMTETMPRSKFTWYKII